MVSATLVAVPSAVWPVPRVVIVPRSARLPSLALRVSLSIKPKNCTFSAKVLKLTSVFKLKGFIYFC